MTRQIIAEKYKTRFFQKVRKTESCWIWEGGKFGTGRPAFNFEGRVIAASRFSYFLHYRELPEKLCVCHKCDNPLCVNPEHLFLGTHKDNVDDKVRKGRQMRGEKHYRTKLSDEIVKEIREVHKTLKSPTKISEIYGISIDHVNLIVHRRRWKHVE